MGPRGKGIRLPPDWQGRDGNTSNLSFEILSNTHATTRFLNSTCGACAVLRWFLARRLYKTWRIIFQASIPKQRAMETKG